MPARRPWPDPPPTGGGPRLRSDRQPTSPGRPRQSPKLRRKTPLDGTLALHHIVVISHRYSEGAHVMRERNALALPGPADGPGRHRRVRGSLSCSSSRPSGPATRPSSRPGLSARSCSLLGGRDSRQRVRRDPAEPGGGRHVPRDVPRHRPHERIHLDVAADRTPDRVAAGPELRQPDPQGQRRGRQSGRGRRRRRLARRRHGEGGLRRRGLRGVRQDPDRDGRPSHGQPLSLRQLRGGRPVAARERGRGDRLAPSRAPGASPGGRRRGHRYAASAARLRPGDRRRHAPPPAGRGGRGRPIAGSSRAPSGWSTWPSTC